MSMRLILLGLLFWTDVYAVESNSPVSGEMRQPFSTSSIEQTFNPDSFALGFYGGNFAVDDEPQFANIHNEYAFGAGISADFTHYPMLALDVEVYFINRDYDTSIGPPLWGTIDEDTSIETNAALVGGRLFYPVIPPFRAYVSAGLGYFQSRLVVFGSLFGFPGIYEDTDSDISFYYGAGVSYMFGDWGLSLDYRYFDISGSFDGFNIDNANVGGRLYLVGWKYVF